MNANTGELKWKYKTNGRVHSSPAVANRILYVGSYDTYVYAFGSPISTGSPITQGILPEIDITETSGRVSYTAKVNAEERILRISAYARMGGGFASYTLNFTTKEVTKFSGVGAEPPNTYIKKISHPGDAKYNILIEEMREIISLTLKVTDSSNVHNLTKVQKYLQKIESPTPTPIAAISSPISPTPSPKTPTKESKTSSVFVVIALLILFLLFVGIV